MHKQLLIYNDSGGELINIETGDKESFPSEQLKSKERRIAIKIDIWSDDTNPFGKWTWDKILESVGLKELLGKW